MNPYLISGPLIAMALSLWPWIPNYTTPSSSQPYHLYDAKNRLGRQSSFLITQGVYHRKETNLKGIYPYGKYLDDITSDITSKNHRGDEGAEQR